jgi:hypothetical protein
MPRRGGFLFPAGVRVAQLPSRQNSGGKIMTWQVKLFNAHAFAPVEATQGEAALLVPSNRHDIYQRAGAWHFVGAYVTWRHGTSVEAVGLYQCIHYAVGDLIALDPQAEAQKRAHIACLAVKDIRMIQTQYLSAAEWRALGSVRQLPPALSQRDSAEWLLAGQVICLARAAVRLVRPETDQLFRMQLH